MRTVEIISLCAMFGGILLMLIIGYFHSRKIKIQQALTGESIPEEVIVEIKYWKGEIPVFYLPDGTEIKANISGGGRIFYYVDENGKTKFVLCKRLEICQVPDLEEGKFLVARGYNGTYYMRKVKRVEDGGHIICSALEKEDVEEPIYTSKLRNNGNVFDNLYRVLYVVTKD